MQLRIVARPALSVAREPGRYSVRPGIIQGSQQLTTRADPVAPATDAGVAFVPARLPFVDSRPGPAFEFFSLGHTSSQVLGVLPLLPPTS